MIKKLLTLLFTIMMSSAAIAAESGKGDTAPASDNAGASVSHEYPEFSKADANGDKLLTRKEAVKAGIPKRKFQDIDYNGDGVVTKTIYEYDLRMKS